MTYIHVHYPINTCIRNYNIEYTQYLFVEYSFQFQLAGTEHEVFADDSARMSTQGTHDRSKLDFTDAHRHGTPAINK